MSDVYRKKGKPDRVVTTEAERTSAVFEGFKPVKDSPKTESPKNEAPKPAAPKSN